MPAIAGLEILQYLVAFSFAFTLRAPVSALGVLLVVNVLVAPLVDMDGTATLFSAVSAILGTLVGGYLGWVLQSPAFVKPRDMLLDRVRAWRMLLLGGALVGTLLFWLLVPVRWVHWSVALACYALVIVLSALTFRAGRSVRYGAAVVFVAHFWWAVFALSAMLALGLATSLHLERGSHDDYPVAVSIVGSAQLVALVLLNSLFPSMLPHAPPSLLRETDLLADTIDQVEAFDARELFENALEMQDMAAAAQ